MRALRAGPTALRPVPVNINRGLGSFAAASALLIILYLVGAGLGDWRWSLLITSPLAAGVLATTLTATGASRRLRLVTAVVAILAFALAVASFATGLDALADPATELSVIYAGAALVAVLRHVLQQRRVTVDMILGAMSAYLLMGIMFAFVYTAIARADPLSFAPPQHPDKGADLFYFSLTTLTTLGYGDVTPATSLVRSISVLQAVLGQAFLVVLVARLVGMEIAGQAQDAAE